MTYRTLDSDHTFGTTAPSDSAPLRHLRARRRAGAMRHRSHGAVLTGFGF